MPAAFRLYSKMDTQWGLSGQLLAGGYLLFYTAGTTTPKHVYGEEALSTDNGVRVDLDSSGRPEVDVWGSGAYFVESYDSDDVKQGEADDVQIPGGEATALPTLVDGEFLTNDGAVMSWAEILQVPDPTGSADKFLTTDGSVLSWADGPEDPTVPTLPDEGITQDTNGFTIGKVKVQRGTLSASASGGKSTTASVTFGTAYATLWGVFLQPTGGGVTADSEYVRSSVTVQSTTGFTAGFSTKTGGSSADSTSNSDITSAVGANWLAIGLVA